MPDPRSSLPRLTLPRAAYGFVLLTMALVALAAGLFLYSRADDMVDQALDRAVRLRTQAAATSYARAIHSDWRDLSYLVGEIARGDRARVRGLMDGMRGDGTRISWIGWAGTDGVVRTASDGLLDGADVSARPWFRNGLRHGFAGDVHEAVLLASLLPASEGGEPPRFIDLAMPVRTEAGEAAGVVAMHIDFGWAARFLSETADSLGLDLFLIGTDGAVIATTTGERPTSAELEILRVARAGSGTGTGTRETWPDGNDYFASLVQQVGYDDLPSFGWRMVGRLDAETFRPGLQSLSSAWIGLVVGLVSIVLAMTALFVRVFMRPMQALARDATRIAEGSADYPPEDRSSAEAAELSAALARLQREGVDP